MFLLTFSVVINSSRLIIRLPAAGVVGGYELPGVGAGIQTVSSGRMISSLNHQAMSPAPPFPYK